MSTMKKIFDIAYWFEAVPGSPDLRFWRMVLIGAAILMVMGIIAVVMMRVFHADGVRRRLWVKISVWSFTVALVAFLLWFFRVQHAYVLSMRFLILLWLLISGVWALMLLRFALFIVPRRLRERQTKSTFTQYLPHKK